MIEPRYRERSEDAALAGIQIQRARQRHERRGRRSARRRPSGARLPVIGLRCRRGTWSPGECGEDNWTLSDESVVLGTSGTTKAPVVVGVGWVKDYQLAVRINGAVPIPFNEDKALPVTSAALTGKLVPLGVDLAPRDASRPPNRSRAPALSRRERARRRPHSGSGPPRHGRELRQCRGAVLHALDFRIYCETLCKAVDIEGAPPGLRLPREPATRSPEARASSPFLHGRVSWPTRARPSWAARGFSRAHEKLPRESASCRRAARRSAHRWPSGASRQTGGADRGNVCSRRGPWAGLARRGQAHGEPRAVRPRVARTRAQRSWQRECVRWLEALDARIPSVVVAPRDANGKDLPAATIAIDGESLDPARAGRAIALDPGVHVARVEVAGRATVEERFVLRERQQDLVLSVLVRGPSDAVVTPAPRRSIPTASWSRSRRRGRRRLRRLLDARHGPGGRSARALRAVLHGRRGRRSAPVLDDRARVCRRRHRCRRRCDHRLIRSRPRRAPRPRAPPRQRRTASCSRSERRERRLERSGMRGSSPCPRGQTRCARRLVRSRRPVRRWCLPRRGSRQAWPPSSCSRLRAARFAREPGLAGFLVERVGVDLLARLAHLLAELLGQTEDVHDLGVRRVDRQRSIVVRIGALARGRVFPEPIALRERLTESRIGLPTFDERSREVRVADPLHDLSEIDLDRERLAGHRDDPASLADLGAFVDLALPVAVIHAVVELALHFALYFDHGRRAARHDARGDRDGRSRDRLRILDRTLINGEENAETISASVPSVSASSASAWGAAQPTVTTRRADVARSNRASMGVS